MSHESYGNQQKKFFWRNSQKQFFALWVVQGALDGRPARLDAGGTVSTPELYSQAFTTNSVEMAVLAITMEPFGQRIEINCDLPARPTKSSVLWAIRNVVPKLRQYNQTKLWWPKDCKLWANLAEVLLSLHILHSASFHSTKHPRQAKPVGIRATYHPPWHLPTAARCQVLDFRPWDRISPKCKKLIWQLKCMKQKSSWRKKSLRTGWPKLSTNLRLLFRIRIRQP